jgi:hypothetical protein
MTKESTPLVDDFVKHLAPLELPTTIPMSVVVQVRSQMIAWAEFARMLELLLAEKQRQIDGAGE